MEGHRGGGGGGIPIQEIEFEGGESEHEDDDDDDDMLTLDATLQSKQQQQQHQAPSNTPWWMDFLKEEGLFADDTGTIFEADGSIAGISIDAEQEGEEEKKNDTTTNKPNNNKLDTIEEADDDDDSVQADDSEDDWKERLWVVSRNHWKYNDPDSPNKHESAEEAELALLQQATSVLAQEDKDQLQIAKFRTQLLTCMVAYVQVFGNNASSAPPLEKPSALRREATNMSPYVPLNVARRLFTLVLKNMNKKKSKKSASATTDGANDDDDDDTLLQEEPPDDASNNSNDDNDDIAASSSPVDYYYAEHVTQVLLSPEMNVFRTYMVEAAGNKRVRTDRIQNDTQRQKDVERIIYGDLGEEKKQDDNDNDEPSGGVVMDPDVPEEEVRIRKGLADWISNLAFSDESYNDVDWSRPFLHQLNGFLSESLNNNNNTDDDEHQVSVSNFVTSRVDKRSETSLAYMYAIRYFPHFYLRSSWRAASSSSSPSLVASYFGNARLIRNRLVVLGIYNGVMVHVAELDALYKELKTTTSSSQDNDDDDDEWSDFYEQVHDSLKECLSSVLQENMRSADFLPSKTTHSGMDWKLTEIKTDLDPTFRIEHDHPQIVSVCLEIGRSFQFQGVTLGKREQDRLVQNLKKKESNNNDDTILPRRNFDDTMTDLEVNAYLEAQSAYQGALKILRRAEQAIQDSHKERLQQAVQDEQDMVATSLPSSRHKMEPHQVKAMQHIAEARVTIELYLADTLTTLAYCYEAKLSEYAMALKWYNDSLALYSRHVGKDHPTVLHALQSVGAIHMQLKQWNQGQACFTECMTTLQRRAPPSSLLSSGPIVRMPNKSDNMDLSLVLKCLGVCKSEIGDHDAAFDALSRSIDQMTLTVLQPQKQLLGNNGPPNDEFICDALSKMVSVLLAKLSSLKTLYARRRLTMLYGEDPQSVHLESLDGPRLTRLQVERRAIVIARDAVRMRRTLLFGDVTRNNNSENDDATNNKKKKKPKWFDLLNLMVDLNNLGKLYFRQCDYDDAISCWKEALSLLDDDDTPVEMLLNDSTLSRSVHAAIVECYEKRLDTVGELQCLIGTSSCRLGKNDDAIAWFEKALQQLEDKRKAYATAGKKKSDDEWDVLDLDVGYCEHALGLTHFYSHQLTAATSHYRESLRLFEAVAARRKGRHNIDPNTVMGPDKLKSETISKELDISINSAIAAVMLSLGTLYNEQDKNDRARRFLEGAIQIVYSTTHRILASPSSSVFGIPSSVLGFVGDLSLVVAVVRVGDAHKRIALMNFKKQNLEEAKLAFEAAMRCLESTNLETRLSLSVDDETHLETVAQSELDEMLMTCYEQMMSIMAKGGGAPENGRNEGPSNSNNGSNGWFGFGKKEDGGADSAPAIAGLTREDLLFRLGNIHAKRGNFDSAIRCLLEARELTEDRLGTSEHPIIGNILFNLGNVYKKIHNANPDKANQKAKERAIESFVESLRIAKLTAGSDSLAAAEVMELLASVLMQDDTKNPDEWTYTDDDGATSFLRDAVAIRNSHRSEMSLPYAQSMHHLGLLRLRQQLQVDDGISKRDDKKLDEAISCLSQALRVRRVLLGDHLDVGNSANSLGVALWKRAISPHGSRKATVNDAMKQLNDALFIRTSFLERTNQDGSTRLRDGSKSKNWRKELDGTEDVGSVVMKTVESMYDISQLHESQRNFEAERNCLKDALSLMEVWLDRLSADRDLDDKSHSPMAMSERNVWSARLYYGLGVSWLETGDYARAAAEFEQSLKFRGLDSIETATANETFDNFFRKQADQPRSESASLSPLASAITMEKLAIAYDKMEKYGEALRCYSFCLRVYGEHFGHTSLKVATILRYVGKVYQDRHDYKRCVRALQRALHIRDSVDAGQYVPRVEDALVYLQLARSLMALGAYDEVALDHFHSAVGILEDVNQIVQNQPSAQPSVIPFKKKPNATEDGIVDGHNTYELLLEGYSAILVLLRRKEVETDEHEENISEVIHHIGNTQAALRQYEKALKSLAHVLEFQRSSKGDEHLSVADLLFNLGNIYVELGRIDEARQCHHECHAISVAVLGNDGIELAENMMCLGNIEFLDTNYPLALEWFDEALRVLQQKGEYEIAVAKCLHRKAVAHDKLGEYDKSIEFFGEVLRLGRRIWGMNHIELSNILNSVGNVHRNRGEIKRALKCYEESLRIRTRTHAELNIANTKNNIGALFMSMDQTDRARQFYAEALRIKTDLLGPDNIETSRTLYNMGQLYVADKQYDKGLRFFEEALRVFKINFGESHTEVASCLCSIGTVCDEMGEEEQALSYFKKALAAVKGQSGAKGVRASALHNVGIILTKRNDIDHAVRIFREALELKASDFESEDMSDTQYCLANVLRLTGCIDEAVELHKASLDTRVHYLGPEHVDVANSMFGLAQALVDTSNHRDALKILQECVRIREQHFGDKSDEFADATFLLGSVLREVGQLLDALHALKLALELKSTSCGENSNEVGDISFKIAIVLCEMGKYDEAKGHNIKALSIRSAAEPKRISEIADTLENMGIVEQKLGDHDLALERMKQAIEIKESIGGENDHDIGAIVHAMAQSFFALDKFEKSIVFFEDAVKRKKRSFGPKHIEVARTLVDEGRVFEKRGDHERALMCYEEAVDADCYEDNSWELGRVFMRMGVTHFALRKAEDAWDCLAEATRIFELVERKERRAGNDTRDTKYRTDRDLHDLIKCYECILRLSEASPTRYSIDKSLVLPKVATILAEIKRYEKASLLFQDAIVLQRSLPGDTRFIVATNLHNLGNCLHHQGNFNEALTCLEDSLGLLQDIPGVEGKHIADTYHSLAFIHQSRSDMHEALTCYSNALKSRRGDSANGNVALVSTLVSMGEVLRSLGMYDAAIKSCKDALRLLEARGDTKLMMVARIVECIGLTHRDRFEYEKALRCFKECLKQRQDAVGINSIAVGKTLHDMALVYSLKGEQAAAEESFRESYRILQSYVGFEIIGEATDPKHLSAQLKQLTDALTTFFDKGQGEYLVDDADTVVALGAIMDQLGMQEEAILCNELASEVLEDNVATDHLLVALAKYRIGAILFKRGDYEASIERLREALEIRRSKLGDNHIETEDNLKMLSRAYAASGDSEMALFYFKEVMNVRKERSSNKTDSESEADLLLRLGKLHLEQAEYADALTCFKDSLRLQRQSSITRDEQKLGETLQCMGATLLEIKQFQEARLTLLSALRLLERGHEDSKELMNAQYLLGRVNEEEWSYDKALAWYDRSLIIQNKMEKRDEVMTARITARIGLVKFAQKDFEEALRLVKEAQDIFHTLYGSSNLEHADCVHACGRIHFETKHFKMAKECFKSALQARQQHLKTDDAELGESFHCLGAVLAELKQYKEASSCLVEALRVRLINFGENGELVGETQQCLGSVELHLGQSNQSTDHFLEAIRIGLESINSRQEITESEYDKLMVCFDAVIPMAKNGIYSEKLGKLYHQKGSLQSMHKQFKQALNSFTEAIQVYKGEYGEDHLNVANALFNVGVCLKETGDSERSMKCFARALTITKLQLGDDHIEVADTMQQMAEVYRMKGDLKGAVKTCEQALEIRRSQEDDALAALLQFSGELYTSCDDSEEAERSFRECVRIRKKVHGDDNMEVSQALYSLGYIHETFRKDHRRALRCFEESLRIRITLMEDRNEAAAKCYLHLGTVHASLHGDAKSFFCFEKAMELGEEIEDPDGVIVEDAIIGQGHALLARGKAADALAQYEKARDRRFERNGDKKESSQEIADLRVYEANALEKLGKEHEALSKLVGALEMYKETVGMDHLGTGGAFQRLSELHLAMGEPDEALTCAQQALNIRKSRLGKHDEATGDSYYIIGRIFFARMDLDTARPCLEAALEIFRHRRGTNHNSVANSMYYLGCVHEYRKDWDESVDYFQGALPIRQKNLGRDHLEVAEVLFKLGISHRKREEFELSSDCLSECLRIRTSSMGQEDIIVADTLFELAGTLKNSVQVSGKLDPSQCYVDAIRIYRQSLGESHVNVAKCLARLGDILEAKKDLKKAGNCYEKAVGIFEVKLKANPTPETMRDYNLERDYEAYAEALLDWATFLDNTGNDGSAMKTYRRALVLLQVVRRQDDEVIDNTLCRIANVLGRQGRAGEALQIIEQVKSRRIAAVGENHPLVADMYFALSQISEKKRDYHDATTALETCLRIRRATLGPFAEEVAACITQMGVLESHQAQFDKAIRTWDEALAIYDKAGLTEEDEEIIAVKEHQENARNMLESMDN